MHKFEPEKQLTLTYKNSAEKKKMHKFEQKRHLTLTYKNHAKKK